MITELELISLERKLSDAMHCANDTGGVPLLELARFSTRTAARLLDEVRELNARACKPLEHPRYAAPRGSRCDCPECASYGAAGRA